MNLRRGLLVLGLLVSAACGLAAHAETYSHRQYYGPWLQKDSYYYRYYYYKPTTEYAGYKHFYCLYYPSKASHYYYYDPYKKVYWGRCPTQCYGKPQYSQLAEEDRKPTLAEIPEEKFPKPEKLPEIPDSKDGAKLDLPPDDVPEQSQPPAVSK